MAVALVLTQAACAHRSSPYHSFDYAAFKRSPTLLGGVAIRVKGPDAGLLYPGEANDLMDRKFRNARHDLSFVSFGVLRDRIGAERYDQLIQDHRISTAIDSSTYALLGEAMGADARYLALARIESLAVTRNESTVDPDYNPKTDNDEVVKTTSRIVWIRLQLYDLKERREMGDAVQAGSISDNVSYPKDRGSGWMSIVKSVFKSDPDYPPAPAPGGAVAAAFSLLAKQIPKK